LQVTNAALSNTCIHLSLPEKHIQLIRHSKLAYFINPMNKLLGNPLLLFCDAQNTCVESCTASDSPVFLAARLVTFLNIKMVFVLTAVQQNKIIRLINHVKLSTTKSWAVFCEQFLIGTDKFCCSQPHSLVVCFAEMKIDIYCEFSCFSSSVHK
jgi:hypothetical protein